MHGYADDLKVPIMIASAENFQENLNQPFEIVMLDTVPVSNGEVIKVLQKYLANGKI